MATVKITDLYKSYGSVEVLKGINLYIEDGGFLVLVGPSGCGKSTLLNTIAGLEEITSGDIEIGQNSVSGLHPSKRNIAMVFQSYALYPNMTVSQNIGFGMEMKGVKKNDREIAVNKVAETLQISELLDRKPGQLSGGQRQRVAIGRAITRNPKIFLFDEPLSNLDAALRAETRVEISKLHKKIKTNMIYVTHDQVEAMTLADRIVILNLGNIEQVGSPDEIYNNPSNIFVAQFIGTPKMNILKVSESDIISGDEIKFLGNNIKLKEISLAKKDYFFGIRPEHFNLSEDCQYKFKPKIDLTENLGNEKIAYMKVDEHEISAKLPGQNNDVDHIGFDVKDIFIFDEDGNRVRS